MEEKKRKMKKQIKCVVWDAARIKVVLTVKVHKSSEEPKAKVCYCIWLILLLFTAEAEQRHFNLFLNTLQPEGSHPEARGPSEGPPVDHSGPD